MNWNTDARNRDGITDTSQYGGRSASYYGHTDLVEANEVKSEAPWVGLCLWCAIGAVGLALGCLL